jgi:hypothetical protein
MRSIARSDIGRGVLALPSNYLGLGSRLRRTHAPYGVSNIVCDEQCAASVQREPDGASVNRLPVLAEEASDDRHRLADRSAVHERYENHLLAVQGAAVPAAVFTDEGAAGKGQQQVLTFAEKQAERCDVRTQTIVGLDRLSDEVRPLRGTGFGVMRGLNALHLHHCAHQLRFD